MRSDTNIGNINDYFLQNYMNKLFFVIVIVIISPPMHAEDQLNGNTLLSHCRPAVKLLYEKNQDVDVFDVAACAEYVYGFTDSLLMHKGMLGIEHSAICIPEKTERRQLIKIVYDYLNNNPDKLHFMREVLVYAALYASFPCNAISK